MKYNTAAQLLAGPVFFFCFYMSVSAASPTNMSKQASVAKLLATPATASSPAPTQSESSGLPIWLLYLAAQQHADQNALSAVITAQDSFVAGRPLRFDAGNSASDSSELIYRWSLRKPDGSYAALNDSNSQEIILEVDMVGSYTLILTVTDPTGLQTEAYLTFVPDLPEPETLPASTPTPPPAPVIIDQADAVRLLYQSTFGPRVEDVQHLMDVGVGTWLDDQLTATPSGYVETWASIAEVFNDIDGINGANGIELSHQTFMVHALYSPDQLRHRMTYALSQLFVISTEFDFSHHDQLTLGYVDVLYENAFGNYRDLLKQVTLHPAMGMFLAMLGNEKADPSRNIRPDENYAREIMQLFTVGLQKLNQDGTPLLDNNNEIMQTYGQADVQNYAAALTGWYFADLEPYRFGDPFTSVDWPLRLAPMAAYDDYHQKTAKKLLRGYYVPANASAEESLEVVLDSLFYHPNLAPFVSLHLIKSFVTSNPSPEYVGRVSAVFNSNETGERGNLGSVIQAVLFDPEARLSFSNQPSTYGRAKDSLTRFVNYWRFFNVQGYDQNHQEHLRRVPDQKFLAAPNVFNFFSPLHVPNAGFAELNLVSPELQIMTPEALIKLSSLFAYNQTLEELEACCLDTSDEQKLTLIHYDLGALPTIQETAGTYAVIDYLDTYLTQGRLSSESRDALFDAYDNSFAAALDSGDRAWYLGTFRELIYYLVSSPEYLIQR